MILPGDAPESIAAAAHCLRLGGLLGLPTETVYGLAANADDDAAVAQIFKAKGRPADHPLIVHVADVGAVAHYASDVPEFARQLMQAFWPGPLTLILPRRSGIANATAGGNPTIGLRCPSHPVAQAVLNALRDTAMPLCVWGLAAPSANQFGRVSPTTAAHVQGEFGDDLLILDGGACDVGIESTIIDCSRGQPVLLRPGAISPEQVQAVCGLKVLAKEALQTLDAPAPKASGTLESHYAPQAQVRLMEAGALQAALRDELNQGCVAVWHRSPMGSLVAGVLYQRMPSDPVTAARQLFAILRAFDLHGVAQIWVEAPPTASEWDGVRDRLQRAAAS
ncbi:L-threonylcarbamoyladenylate synthase [Rhodoferax sp.]|uniref:L-threonylcarbamoyladenylate synthase n=1 Tax=Rhodoferax sp. TaxID=50421 RepID=UPI0027311908|nr:L-threonylcarbamoyladenylate synthase [Rhodoferax sp.]MDP1528745.1 L-threonylcarbamoyladenylate synthase [Rhodoferax sp.]MDP1943770.1 L-threonylcarbamoyladenylate synthase [Rhodoferax sp.]MDP2441838.1 L-threonylcarbamoyladenylate synthase [Rhodoferax sp.]MDZ4208146.1 L-threonylcarbamoyladenylate synthase [Rhodoferax sp.]